MIIANLSESIINIDILRTPMGTRNGKPAGGGRGNIAKDALDIFTVQQRNQVKVYLRMPADWRGNSN